MRIKRRSGKPVRFSLDSQMISGTPRESRYVVTSEIVLGIGERRWAIGPFRRSRSIPPPPTVRCDRCGKPLVRQFESTKWAGYDQFENALQIEFSGGYGEFVDTYDGPITVRICHDCAHVLCDNNPFIQRAVRPETSHTHEETLSHD